MGDSSTVPVGQTPEDAHADPAFQAMLADVFAKVEAAGELAGPSPSFGPEDFHDQSGEIYIEREFTLDEFERWYQVQRLGSLPFNAIGYHHTWNPHQHIWAGIESLRGVFNYYHFTLGWTPFGMGPHLFVYSGDGRYSPGTPRVYVATHPAHDGYGMVSRNGRWLHIEHVWNGDADPFSEAMKEVSGKLLGILCRPHPHAPRQIPLHFIRDGGINNPSNPIGIMYHRDEIPRPKSCPGNLVTHENLDPSLIRYARMTLGGDAPVITTGATGRAWRSIGKVDRSVWDDELGALDSPILSEGDAPYEAAGEHSALCLAQILHESVGGTKGLATTGGHNCLGQRPRPGDDIPSENNFARFDTWADCIRYWHGKIVDPGYAYAPTTSLAEFIAIYSPDSDNAPGQEAMYVARLEAWLDRWGIVAKRSVSAGGEAPRAAFVERKPIEGPVKPKLLNGRLFLPLHETRWTAVESTPRKQYADPAAGEVGPPVEKGETITAHYVVAGEDGQLWFVHEGGTRMSARAFVAA